MQIMENQFKEIASLIGDPTRASVLWALMEGRALTATELAISADTSAQNISMHLNKLVKANLLAVESQGRHRYYRFARKEIAYAMESLTCLIPNVGISADTNGNSESMVAVKYCRTCYDHLAGKIGVELTDSLLKQKLIVLVDKSFELTAKGMKWFAALGIDIENLKEQRRSFIRPCLDWSERRYHIAGSLAEALLQKMMESGIFKRIKNSRALLITPTGHQKLHELFKLSIHSS
jgi:DNA-binding transcriptional ArsR family regulator